MSLLHMSLVEAAIEIAKRGGWIMVPIFLTGWWAWLLILERGFKVWWLMGKPYQGLWSALETGGVDAAKAWLHKGRGVFVEMARQVLKVYPQGYKAVHHGIEQLAVERSNELRRHMRTISRLAGIAPLLGLLGTVSGIVHTFAAIESMGFGNPVVLANGISEALLATQAGLLVAFPVAIFHNVVLQRIERLEVKSQAEAHRFAKWLDQAQNPGVVA